MKYLQPAPVPVSSAPFSQIVVDDLYAHLAGLVAADFPEGVEVLGDVESETKAVMDAIKTMLSSIDLPMSQIVRVDVHLSNLDDFDAMDRAYRAFFSENKFPARTTTQSDRLFGDSKVEITCMARLLE